MEGAVELAEEIFHMPVRLARPQGVSGLDEILHSPIYATGVGLLLYAARNLGEPVRGNPARGTPARGSAARGRRSRGDGQPARRENYLAEAPALLERMKSWFQNNF
jgi:cell division protein FtsA